MSKRRSRYGLPVPDTHAPWPARPPRPLSSARVVAIVKAMNKLDIALRRFTKRVRRAGHLVPTDVRAVQKRLKSYTKRFGQRARDEDAHEALATSNSTHAGIAVFTNSPPLLRRIGTVVGWVRSFRSRPGCQRSRDRRRVEAAWRQLEAASTSLEHHLRKKRVMKRLGHAPGAGADTVEINGALYSTVNTMPYRNAR